MIRSIPRDVIKGKEDWLNFTAADARLTIVLKHFCLQRVALKHGSLAFSLTKLGVFFVVASNTLINFSSIGLRVGGPLSQYYLSMALIMLSLPSLTPLLWAFHGANLLNAEFFCTF